MRPLLLLLGLAALAAAAKESSPASSPNPPEYCPSKKTCTAEDGSVYCRGDRFYDVDCMPRTCKCRYDGELRCSGGGKDASCAPHCRSDGDCAVTIRSSTAQPGLYPLCSCEARSTSFAAAAAFDECLGEDVGRGAVCRRARCANSCENMRAFCSDEGRCELAEEGAPGDQAKEATEEEENGGGAEEEEVPEEVPEESTEESTEDSAEDSTEEEALDCPADVRVCDDGTVVGRLPMFGCEFEDCPSPNCHTASSCEECLAGRSCGAWAAGRCFPDCSVIADVACYAAKTPEDAASVCARADRDEADAELCRGKSDSCEACVGTVLSDGESTCQWHGSWCGAECLWTGCGATTCEADADAAPGAGAACTEDVRDCGGFFISRNPANGCEFEACPDALFCTADVFDCGDGVFVSRDPANGCEFEACPDPVFCAADVFDCGNNVIVIRDPANGCEFEACPEQLSEGCIHNGLKYSVGEEYKVQCNRCSCQGSGGISACTMMACDCADCTYDSQTYCAGERFLAKDGCNTCQCGKKGEVICSRMLCEPQDSAIKSGKNLRH